MAGKVRTHVDLPAPLHKRLEQVAEAEQTTMSAQIALALTAYFKAKRDGIGFDTALALTAPIRSKEEEERREYLKIAQDTDKPDTVRIEAYIRAKADIPFELTDAAKDYLAHPDASTEPEEAHYEETDEGLLYIPAGMERYRLTRDYWFDMNLLTDPGLQERFVQYRVAQGLPELAMRQRMAQILQNPPREDESGYAYYSRLHQCSEDEAAARIARGE